MPLTTAEAEAFYQNPGDPNLPPWWNWPIPSQPPLTPEQEPWFGVPGSFWKDAVTDWVVDADRTAALADVDIPIVTSAGGRPYDGTSYGIPFQVVDSATTTPTKVWDLSRAPTWSWSWATWAFSRTNDPITKCPLPAVVRREGDPAGSSDQSVRLWDPAAKRLWEFAQLQHQPSFMNWRTFGTTDWVTGYPGAAPGPSVWDTSKAWNAPGQPPGIVAGGWPMLPLVIRYEEVLRGRITHAVHGVLPNYGPERVGPARGGDGTRIGYPVRAGDRLRLKRSAVERFTPGTTARMIAEALWEYGWVQGDRNSFDQRAGTKGFGVGSFHLTMDWRWAGALGDDLNHGKTPLRLADFEVLRQP